jgi:hypothetical protein
MKKSVLIITILLVISAIFVNAEILKKSALWGFGITGKVADETPSLTVQPINPNYPPCPTTFTFTNKENINYSFDVKVWPNEVDIGFPGFEGKYKLHFFESNSHNNKTIISKEFFVVTTNSPQQSRRYSHVLQFVGINISGRKVAFNDLGTGPRAIVYDPSGRGDLIVGGQHFRFYVDPEAYRIAVDQNADGVLNGVQTLIVSNDGNAYTEEYFTGNKNCQRPSVICSDSDKSSSYNMRVYGPDNLTLNRPDVFTFGQVNFNPPGKASLIINDACFNGTHLAEGFCQQDKYQGRQGITCPSGCKGGVCLTNETVTATTCTDSDGGLNTNTFGWTDFKAGSFESRHPDACALVLSYDANGVPQSWRGPDPGQEQNWSCSGENCYVEEAFCRIDEKGNFIDADADQLIKCQNGCQNGACLPEPVCSDSDGGLNFSSKGYVKVAFGGGSDCCIDDKMQCSQNGSSVMELYCNPGSPTGFSEHIYNCQHGCQDGACIEHVVILGPPIATQVAETVTCLFALPYKGSTCTSSKGNCTGIIGRGSSSCQVTVSGTPGEKVTWTSDCGRNVRPATTTIDGIDENAGFACIRRF